MVCFSISFNRASFFSAAAPCTSSIPDFALIRPGVAMDSSLDEKNIHRPMIPNAATILMAWLLLTICFIPSFLAQSVQTFLFTNHQPSRLLVFITHVYCLMIKPFVLYFWFLFPLRLPGG
ncbi:Irc16p [Saccharomyces cerevisiae S288C]|uniref:Uncharacterized protein IRC16 n=2 Tax=Saccharomyces cerevisiae TaxID=4932 RepID=IRC16_YEAST|nr:Irc16p [Saccharomyces cerevisiae S288C]Q6B0V8.1 RecName: Full=Uncharacterized protein IRC16; AltName: Full=Increased recombination centers protein 16 [Saccharomyces cerevisiae S288C]pir/S69474/ hypothetical protein YPR038w - yeast (Saccharomyces cerevisiae) [Saccharomyces cerevisiae]CAY86994.1 Irc16p [Saccharomyces cerevisiae EC1118]AAT93341.1 YPR038W [Saccharomyces cerevisiae]KZV07555.1 hypothetical protein WN66_06590 [Saccharomyces cerevisiae]DAD54812.1 TPA: Irc16p [Saccharomyces cerevis